MKIILQKYGGSSLSTPLKIKKAAKNVINYRRNGYKVVVVVSALGNTTDELLRLANKISRHPSERELDMLISTGEQIAVALFTMALQELRYDAISFTGFQIGIITDGTFRKARIVRINADRIKKSLCEGKIVVVAGFQGINLNQEITTLGRGGSDLTAVALAKTLDAEICEIYTDVEGVYTVDPRIEKNARKISHISYEEMLELASSGTQVMQARSIEFAKRYGVKIHVKSSLKNTKGTIISEEVSKMEDIYVTGISLNTNEAKVTICDVPDKPGIAAYIFGKFSKQGINVDMIVQNVSREFHTDVSFTVNREDLIKTEEVARKVAKEIGASSVITDDKIAKVSIVGVGMRSHAGIAAKMFDTLAKEKINIEMISTSEIKISCVIRKKSAKKAVRALHKEFHLDKLKR